MLKKYKLTTAYITICLLLCSCAILSEYRIKKQINSDLDILIKYKSEFVELRNIIINDERVIDEKIASFYNPVFKGMTIELNKLQSLGSNLNSTDYSQWKNDFDLFILEFKAIKEEYKKDIGE